MSREEAMEAFIESGMELRRDDIELGKELERERIIQALTNHLTRDSKRDWNPGLEYCYECGGFDYLLPDLVALIKGETNELLEILADK